MKEDIFKNIKILDYIEKVEFFSVEGEHVCYKPKTFKEIFGMQVCYISGKETTLKKKKIEVSEEESNYDSEVIDTDTTIFFQLRIKFNTYQTFTQFKEKFEEYYESSKKSYYFWLNVKAKFNEEMCDKYRKDIEDLAEEIDTMNSYHIKKD